MVNRSEISEYFKDLTFKELVFQLLRSDTITFLLRPELSLSYPTREVTKVELIEVTHSGSTKKMIVATVSVLGLYGASGNLPVELTEYMIQENSRGILQEVLDVFNHILLINYYHRLNYLSARISNLFYRRLNRITSEFNSSRYVVVYLSAQLKKETGISRVMVSNLNYSRRSCKVQALPCLMFDDWRLCKVNKEISVVFSIRIHLKVRQLPEFFTGNGLKNVKRVCHENLPLNSMVYLEIYVEYQEKLGSIPPVLGSLVLVKTIASTTRHLSMTITSNDKICAV